MSEPFIKNANKKSFSLARVVFGALVVVGVAALGFIAYKFISYKESGGIPTDPSFAQVAISSPPQGVQLEVSESVMVEAAAIGSNTFASMELWINGELLGVQAAPSGGVHPFSTFFSWMPDETGAYSLRAAAIDVDGNKEMSAQVAVFVIQSETGIEFVSSDSPTVFPVPSGGGYSPPAGPGSGESAGPAENWSGSTGDWVTSLIAEVKPASPELIVNAGECAAELQIHDLSDNEEGFVVYRQAGFSPMWVQVATLSSQSDVDWINYTDEGIYGAVNYYVTAFNSKGESKSDYVFVSINPTDCVSESEEIAVGKLGMTLQVPNLKAEWVYCYLSTDGINWDRWPVTGFLTPDDDGISAEILALDLTGNGSGEEQTVPSMDLFMECWGWQGGELKPIGKLATTEFQPQLNGSQTILGEGMIGNLKLIPGTNPNNMDSFFDINFEIEDLGILMNLDQMVPLTAISPEIPRVYLNQTTDREICGQHLPPDAQNIFGYLLYCFPYPPYDPDKGGTVPQPYLVWDLDFFEPNCIGGMSEECKTYWELLDLAEENGGQVGFTIVSMRGGIKSVWNVTEPELTMFVVPPLPCIGGTEFSVRMWYRPGNKGVGVSASSGDQISEISEVGLSTPEMLYGPYSNWITIPCNNSGLPSASIIEKVQFLDVTFESVEFFDLDDDDGDFGEVVELYGYFRVKAPAMGHWENEQCFFPEFGYCDEEPFWTDTRRNLNLAYWEIDNLGFSTGPSAGGLHTYIDGLYDLNNEFLCQSNSKYSCNENQSTAWKTGNNTIRVFVKDGDALKFDVMLIDYDELSANDTVCIDTILTPSRSLNEWSSIDESYIMLGPTGGSGGCEVNIKVKAVDDPVLYSNP